MSNWELPKAVNLQLKYWEFNNLCDHAFQKEASYIIRKDGFYYVAINGSTGQIDYGGSTNEGSINGTNATDVINAAAANLTAGRTWLEKIIIIGDITLTDTLIISSNTIVQLEGSLKLANNINKGLLRNEHWGPTTLDSDIWILNGIWDGQKAIQTIEANDGCISLRGVSNCIIVNTKVKDFWGFGGIYVAGDNSQILHNTVSGCKKTSGSYGAGIYITGLDDDENTIFDNRCLSNEGTGIFIEDYSANNKVLYNIVKYNLRDGIWVNLGTGNQVTHNTVVGASGLGGAGDYGIEIDSDNNEIHNNVISDTTYNAWIVHSPRTGNRITGNRGLTVSCVTGNFTRNNTGWIDESSGFSELFFIDTTGVKTIGYGHNFSFTPLASDVSLSVVEVTNVDDWAYDLLKIESVDASNVVIKINVSTASATGGATAKIAVKVNGQK